MGKMEMEEESMDIEANMGLGEWSGEGEGGRSLTKTEVGTILMIFRPPRRPACQHPPPRRRGRIFATVEIIIAPLVLAASPDYYQSRVEWSRVGVYFE